MDVEQAMALVRVVEHGWPQKAFSEESAMVYLDGLKDLPAQAAFDALRSLVRTSEFRPTVAEVRRETARSLGQLPPGLDDALGQAAEWSRWSEQRRFQNGNGELGVQPGTHPVVMKVCLELSPDLSDPTWRHLFRAAYREAVAEAEREALASDASRWAIGDGS